jgi:hypothetical protein
MFRFEILIKLYKIIKKIAILIASKFRDFDKKKLTSNEFWCFEFWNFWRFCRCCDAPFVDVLFVIWYHTVSLQIILLSYCTVHVRWSHPVSVIPEQVKLNGLLFEIFFFLYILNMLYYKMKLMLITRNLV